MENLREGQRIWVEQADGSLKLYASSPDFSSDPAWLVDAAFRRYAREAADYAGGRHLSDAERVDRARVD